MELATAPDRTLGGCSPHSSGYIRGLGCTLRPKGEEKVDDREEDAVIKVNFLVIENPGPFSHNCAAEAGLCSVSSSLRGSHGGERILSWEGLPHSSFV